MLRRWIVALVALALPFVVYWIYQRLERRHVQSGKDPWPFAILWLAGMVLAFETLMAAALSEPRTQGRYVPPYMNEQGEIVPGRVIPEEREGPDQ